MMNFNINDKVRIKLNDTGREILKAHHQELYGSIGRPNQPYHPVHEDAEGWSDWQLWYVMATFGPYIHLAGTPPFETTIQIKE
jgi:hypothetical protein